MTVCHRSTWKEKGMRRTLPEIPLFSHHPRAIQDDLFWMLPPCPIVSGTYSYPGSLPSSCSVVTPYHSPLGTFAWTCSESQAALPYLVKPQLFREASQRQSQGGEGRRGYFQFSPGSIREWGDSGACRLHSVPAHSLSQPHVTLSGAYYVAGKVYSSFILANSHIVL